MGTDRDWDRWGRADPYFGVLSSDEYRANNMNESAREDFFRSGETHIEHTITIIRSKFDDAFAPRSALDFGCGVGRLVIPLARRMGRVVGLDISDAMIAEAVRNCTDAQVTNVTIARSDDDLSSATQSFDIVHSYLVLQHISWRRGRKILQRLADHVDEKGVICVQFLTACHAPTTVRALVRLRYLLPPVNWLRNILRRRPVFEPAMRLYVYDLKKITGDLRASGFDDEPVLLKTPPDSEFPFESIYLFARRTRPSRVGHESHTVIPEPVAVAPRP